MSSENCARIAMAESPRFPGEGSSSLGKPGAKARPKGVVDAHTVEIPWPRSIRYLTRRSGNCPAMVARVERD